MKLVASLRICLLAVVCITHTYACEDVAYKFNVKLDNGETIQKNCNQARKNPWGQCAKPEIVENCPKTCAVCPGDARCRIKADLQFPQGESFTGYHSESAQIEKIGENQACFSGNTRTNWGCTQVCFSGNSRTNGCTEVGGDALIDGKNGFIREQSTSVRVFDGRNSTLRVGVSHIFSEAEVMQEPPDFAGRANLIIKVNGVLDKSFRHGKNTIKATHIDYDQVNQNNENVGFINPQYNGDYFVDIQCDDECNCDIVQKDAECKLKAQLKFPKISELQNYGQRSEAVKVFNVKRDYEQCSQVNPNTSWCKSYAEALVLNIEDEWYYDLNMAQFINIPDAADGHFQFFLNRTDRIQDQPLILDHAQLDIYVNGETMVYDQDLLYGPSFFNVACDSFCNCTSSWIVA